MKIKTKFRLNTLLVVAMVMLIGVVQFYASSRLNSLLEKRHLIHETLEKAISLNVVTFDFLMDHAERANKQWFIAHKSLAMVLEKFHFKSKYKQMLLTKIKRNHGNLKTIFPMLMTKSASNIAGSKDVSKQKELQNRLKSQVMVKIQDIVFTTLQLDDMSERELFNIHRNNTFFVFGTLILISLLIAVNSILIGRSILTPIRQLQSGTRVIGKGDLNYKTGITSKDEIGELSKAFDNMTEHLKKTMVSLADLENEILERKATEKRNKNLEGQILQMKKLETIGTLAGGIAHDFNNILSPILGFTEISIEDLPENHPIQENLKDILQGAKRARDLVKQILTFSRQRELEEKPVLPGPLIKEALKLLRATIPSSIEIQRDLSDNSDYVLANPTEIHEIIMNLCTNAYHAMEETGGVLKVSLNRTEPDSNLDLPAGKYCCLSISDTGIGIPKEIINNIFDPYFTTKELGKGSGLGLSVIHGIVKNYKGAISVESRPKKGAVFNVYLPVTSKTENLDEKSNQVSSPGGEEKILFVDDETAIVKFNVRILERLGYKVTGKTSSIEALDLFKSDPGMFDLVVTDMAMPAMVGTEFAKKLLEIRPDIPIIICTGFSERLDSKVAKFVGIREYIKKPILTNELSLKIRKVLDQNIKLKKA